MLGSDPASPDAPQRQPAAVSQRRSRIMALSDSSDSDAETTGEKQPSSAQSSVPVSPLPLSPVADALAPPVANDQMSKKERLMQLANRQRLLSSQNDDKNDEGNGSDGDNARAESNGKPKFSSILTANAADLESSSDSDSGSDDGADKEKIARDSDNDSIASGDRQIAAQGQEKIIQEAQAGTQRRRNKKTSKKEQLDLFRESERLIRSTRVSLEPKVNKRSMFSFIAEVAPDLLPEDRQNESESDSDYAASEAEAEETIAAVMNESELEAKDADMNEEIAVDVAAATENDVPGTAELSESSAAKEQAPTADAEQLDSENDHEVEFQLKRVDAMDGVDASAITMTQPTPSKKSFKYAAPTILQHAKPKPSRALSDSDSDFEILMETNRAITSSILCTDSTEPKTIREQLRHAPKRVSPRAKNTASKSPKAVPFVNPQRRLLEVRKMEAQKRQQRFKDAQEKNKPAAQPANAPETDTTMVPNDAPESVDQQVDSTAIQALATAMLDDEEEEAVLTDPSSDDSGSSEEESDAETPAVDTTDLNAAMEVDDNDDEELVVRKTTTRRERQALLSDDDDNADNGIAFKKSASQPSGRPSPTEFLEPNNLTAVEAFPLTMSAPTAPPAKKGIAAMFERMKTKNSDDKNPVEKPNAVAAMFERMKTKTAAPPTDSLNFSPPRPASPMDMSQDKPPPSTFADLASTQQMQEESDEMAFKTLRFGFDDYDSLDTLDTLDGTESVASSVDEGASLDGDLISPTQQQEIQERSARLLEITQDSTESSSEPSNAAVPSLLEAVRREMNRLDAGAESETVAQPRLKRLVRKTDFKDEAENEGQYVIASRVRKAEKEQKVLPRSEFVEAEAEIEEDEFMHFGGVDGEDPEAEKALREELAAFIDEEDSELAKLTLKELEERIKQDEDVRRFFLQQMREKDLKATKNLVKDITTGKILERRKHQSAHNTASAIEEAKFGREDDDETSPALRELDDAQDYGVFAEIIGRYVADRRRAGQAGLRKRKRHGQLDAEDGDEEGKSAPLPDAMEDDHDWTNEHAVGGICITPGEMIETDLERIEERIKRRAVMQRMEKRTNEQAADNLFEEDDSSVKILSMINTRTRTTKKTKSLKESAATPARLTIGKKLSGINENSAANSNESPHLLQALSPKSLARYKSSIGIREEDLRGSRNGNRSLTAAATNTRKSRDSRKTTTFIYGGPRQEAETQHSIKVSVNSSSTTTIVSRTVTSSNTRRTSTIGELSRLGFND